MPGFWEFVAVVALCFLALRYLARRRASATAGGSDQDWGETAGAWGARDHDIRARAAKEPLESWLLHPEPADRQRSGAGAEAGYGARSSGVPGKVAESVTAVLRKQIPPRDEPPRSWLGGLPMLPPEVEWPRGVNPENTAQGEVPLHFIAQIACADLPAEVWGGLGPREGWLLLFVNGNTCEADDTGVWRLLHVDDLGQERQPPTGIGPIHDGVYTGSTPFTLRESVYPCWPVDVVAMPNELRIEDGRALAAPENLAQRLYPGQAIGEERGAPKPRQPYDVRTLAAGLRSAADALAKPYSRPTGATVSDHYLSAADRARFESYYRSIEEKAAASADLEWAAQARARAARAREIDGQWRACVSVAELEARLEALHADYLTWREETLAVVRGWLAELDAGQPEAPISEAYWQKFEGLTKQRSFVRINLQRHGGYGDQPEFFQAEEQTFSVASFSENAWAQAARDCFPAAYLDSRRRGGLPADAVAEFEAYWRKLYENRPHRMGGYHDGLQSDAEPGPTDRLLLMQFAVDDALQWVWGDNGAVYCFIAPEHLQNRAWEHAEFWLECH